MTYPSIVEAAVSLTQPGVDCFAEGNNVSDLVWRDINISKPSDADLQSEVDRLQAEYDSKQYARNRAEAYPSLTEQADMAYWDRQNGTTTLDDAINAVKAEFPKP